MYYNLLFLTLLLTPLFVYSGKEIVKIDREIELNTGNSIIIRGEINDKMATEFVFDLNRRKSKKDLYIFLDTNGGSVDAGNKIVYEIQKYNISCIASRAISMGFVILQSCNRRFITPLGTLMQHQMSYGISDEKAKVESYVEYIKQIGDYLTELQSNKIGISKREFERRTYNDWWLFGKNAVDSNCVDDMSMVTCSSKLTNSTYTQEKGSYIYTYSKCPLITGEIDKKKNPNKNNDIFDIFFLSTNEL